MPSNSDRGDQRVQPADKAGLALGRRVETSQEKPHGPAGSVDSRHNGGRHDSRARTAPLRLYESGAVPCESPAEFQAGRRGRPRVPRGPHGSHPENDRRGPRRPGARARQGQGRLCRRAGRHGHESRGKEGLPARHGLSRPRPARPDHLRRAHLDDDRPGRNHHRRSPGHPRRGHRRLRRRHGPTTFSCASSTSCTDCPTCSSSSS